jgi:hypothetical protein
MVVFENRSGADIWVRERAHDPENRNRFSERIMRKPKVLQRPLRIRKDARRCRSAENRHLQAGLT